MLAIALTVFVFASVSAEAVTMQFRTSGKFAFVDFFNDRAGGSNVAHPLDATRKTPLHRTNEFKPGGLQCGNIPLNDLICIHRFVHGGGDQSL